MVGIIKSLNITDAILSGFTVAGEHNRGTSRSGQAYKPTRHTLGLVDMQVKSRKMRGPWMVHNTTGSIDYSSAAARTISLAVGNHRVDPLLYSLVRVTNVHVHVHVSKVIQEQMDVVL